MSSARGTRPQFFRTATGETCVVIVKQANPATLQGALRRGARLVFSRVNDSPWDLDSPVVERYGTQLCQSVCVHARFTSSLNRAHRQ